MSIVIIKPGMLSSFQDAGRHGQQPLGISVVGAMDQRAHHLANMLVGNDAQTASLEITLTGPTLQFQQPCCIALSGGDLSATLNGQAVASNRPIVVRPNDTLAFGPRKHGTRCYLAVHGGFALTPVLGSTSTYLRSHFGGWQGRALKKGDEIPFARPLATNGLEALAMELWSIKIYLPSAIADSSRQRIRLIKSALWNEFTPESCVALLTEPRQLLSEATTFGTIQVPAGGQPIILIADRQTTGGYPKMAYVATVDLPLLAQCAPGDALQFEAITLERAQELDAARERAWHALAQTLQPIRDLLLHH